MHHKNFTLKISSIFTALLFFVGHFAQGQIPAVYTCSSYTVMPITYAPVNSIGTPVSLGDDALSVALPIGFNFDFYCNSYTQFRISSNGFITFDLGASSNGCCTGQLLPDNVFAPDNLIALAWEDLNPSLNGTIDYFTIGLAPNRQLVVRFNNVPRFGNASNVTVQVVLHETTNYIDIHTTNVSADGATTQGIENQNGTIATTTPGRNSSVWFANNDAYRFVSGNTLNASIYGKVYQDFNQNCQIDANELGLPNRNLIIQPGNIIVQTNASGAWDLDSLPAGNYTITADTSGPWQLTCPITQNFTVIHPDTFLFAPSFGFVSTNPCPSPDVSINMPFLRPGIANQKVYVQACNGYLGTALVDSVYVVVELDSLISVQSGSLAYTSLGNNQYRVNVGSLAPGQCVSFWLDCTLSTTAILGQTLCMNAEFYPVDTCVLDEIPTPYSFGNVSPCTLPWDRSSLSVEGSCVGDSVRFVIYNTGVLGSGDMDCFAPVRVYLDGAWILLDSIQLQGGDSIVFMFAGNGQTWRLEADQHPLHPGNSHPNATVELCGNPANWTSNLVNILPHDDADPIIDIYCGLVTGSYDPNDKTGYPLGVGNDHNIQPNQDLQYVIRFQNTGTDTAFTVVIRDTLSMDLDILSVKTGVSSHNYDFRMYGTRILEWSFYNIMLPDSNVNQAASNDFVTFNVRQTPDLPNGTVLENSAAIYFDFNAPIITNTSWHTINDGAVFLNTDKQLVEKHLPIKIYPNPTTGLLHIDKTNNAEINILVLDNLGRILHSQQSNDTITTLNINHFPAGVYYISVNNGKEISTQKIVKQ